MYSHSFSVSPFSVSIISLFLSLRIVFFIPGNIMQLNKKKTKFFGGNGPSLGLIDYGQTKTITDEERYGVAKVIMALVAEEKQKNNNNNNNNASSEMTSTNLLDLRKRSKRKNKNSSSSVSSDDDNNDDNNNYNDQIEKVATTMRDLGFVTKHDNSLVLSKYARLFFDSDEEGKIQYNCPTPQTYFKLLTECDPLVTVPDVAVFVGRCGFMLRGLSAVILGTPIKTSHRWSVYAQQAVQQQQQQQKQQQQQEIEEDEGGIKKL